MSYAVTLEGDWWGMRALMRFGLLELNHISVVVVHSAMQGLPSYMTNEDCVAAARWLKEATLDRESTKVWEEWMQEERKEGFANDPGRQLKTRLVPLPALLTPRVGIARAVCHNCLRFEEERVSPILRIILVTCPATTFTM